MLKIKKVEKAFTKVMKEEIGADGYVNINKVEIYPNENIVEISGNYGEYCGEKHEANWHESFRLSYTNGRPLEFLKGMFYHELSKNFQGDGKVKQGLDSPNPKWYNISVKGKENPTNQKIKKSTEKVKKSLTAISSYDII